MPNFTPKKTTNAATEAQLKKNQDKKNQENPNPMAEPENHFIEQKAKQPRKKGKKKISERVKVGFYVDEEFYTKLKYFCIHQGKTYEEIFKEMLLKSSDFKNFNPTFEKL